MTDNYLITGYWGEPHVTAENDRGIHAGIFGAGRFVLPVGEQFRAEYIGNNTIRMYDGKLMDNGAAAGIPAGKYVDLLISNAGQGMKRNDLIVFQYSLDASTLIESGTFVVIPGVETTGTPMDHAIKQGDLLSGKATFDQMPMWRVSVSGVTISAPEKLFTVTNNLPTLEETLEENLNAHTKKTDNPHSVTKAQVGLSNVPNVATNNQTPTFTEGTSLVKLTSGEKLSVAFGKIAKAITDLISHIRNKSNPHGVTAAQIPDLKCELWTFTLADGSTVEKAVYARRASSNITVEFVNLTTSGDPSWSLYHNEQFVSGAGNETFTANFGDKFKFSVGSEMGHTVTINGVVVEETSDYTIGTMYEYTVVNSVLIEYKRGNYHKYLSITER